MQISVKSNGNWAPVSGFSEALEPFMKPGLKVAAVGSGGKTSILMRLAEEQREQGKKALVMTTTHMYKPEKYGVFSGKTDDIEAMLQSCCIAIAGKEEEDSKISWQGYELYREASMLADIVLIEADGSKRLPAKFPNSTEPVIPPDIDLILAVSGLSAIGLQGKDACHRWPLAMEALGLKNEDEILLPEHLSSLLDAGYLLPLWDKFPKASIIPVFNQADNETLIKAGQSLVNRLKTPYGIVSNFGITEE